MALLCAISGEAPTNPVVSIKSGAVFEKRLVEAYIAENSKDPITGEELTTSDLIDLKSAHTVRPRPPELTSIPSLLATFQNEWDALTLESHSLQQQLIQTRQELSTALYQHDAATRVIARLLKERDDARDALSKVTLTRVPPEAKGDQMEVDHQEIPPAFQQKIESTKAELFGDRKKRVIPAEWATVETISGFCTIFTSSPLCTGAKAVALNPLGEFAAFGGADGIAGIYSIPQKQLLKPLKAEDGAINDVGWAGRQVITGSATGVVRLWDERGSSSSAMMDHTGEVTAIATHPSNSIIASAGMDECWIMYDLQSARMITKNFTSNNILAAEFHPDGHLFAAGTSSSVMVYDVRSGSLGATFGPLSAPVSSLNFSENGIWLALSVQDQSTVEIWDLRKMCQTKVLEVGTRIDHVKWDYTGQFLAVAGPSGISLQHFAKSSKSWSEPLRNALPAVATAWGPSANSLISLQHDGTLTILGVA